MTYTRSFWVARSPESPRSDVKRGGRIDPVYWSRLSQLAGSVQIRRFGHLETIERIIASSVVRGNRRNPLTKVVDRVFFSELPTVRVKP